jgi:hypothetical protein
MRSAVLVFAALLGIPAVAHAGDGKDLLPLVGDDVQVVMVIDVADAHDAAIFQTLMQKAITEGWSGTAELAQLGVVVERDLDTLLIAGSEGAAAGRMAVLEGRFPALDTVLDGFATTKHRKVTYWTGDGHDIAMIGKRLVITDAGAMDAVIDRAKKKSKASLTRSPKAAGLRTAIALTDTRQDIWMAASHLSMGGMDLEAMSLGLALGTDAVVQAKLQAPSPETAATWVGMVEGYLDQVRGWLGQVGLTGFGSSLTIGAEGDVVELDATMPGTELDALVGLASFL